MNELEVSRQYAHDLRNHESHSGNRGTNDEHGGENGDGVGRGSGAARAMDEPVGSLTADLYAYWPPPLTLTLNGVPKMGSPRSVMWIR